MTLCNRYSLADKNLPKQEVWQGKRRKGESWHGKFEVLIFPHGEHEAQRAGVTCSRSHSRAGTSTHGFCPSGEACSHQTLRGWGLRNPDYPDSPGLRRGSGQENSCSLAPVGFFLAGTCQGHAVFPPWASARAARYGSLLESQLWWRRPLCRKHPPGHQMTRPWGHGVATEGLITPSRHSCLWPPPRSAPGGMAGFPASCWVPLREWLRFIGWARLPLPLHLSRWEKQG